MNWLENIFRFFFKIFFVLAFVTFIVVGGATCAFLVFQYVYDVSDTVVPSVIGDELNVAQGKLYNAGLKIYVYSEEFKEGISQNKIISQDPVSGVKVKKSREIYVVISKEGNNLSLNIPDLRNKELEEAIDLIEEYGLTLDRVTYTYHFFIHKDIIIAQTPEPGKVNVNSKNINLLVSKGPY